MPAQEIGEFGLRQRRDVGRIVRLPDRRLAQLLVVRLGLFRRGESRADDEVALSSSARRVSSSFISSS